MRGLIAALGAVVVIAAAPAAQADVQPYATNDAGGFHDVLPPGANGMANGVELAAFLTTGARPAHNDDQLAMYRDLMYATPGLKAPDLGRYFKDSTFGIKPGDIASSITPRNSFAASGGSFSIVYSKYDPKRPYSLSLNRASLGFPGWSR